MNRQAAVYNNDVLTGILEERPDGYSFRYDTAYLTNTALPAISLTLPKADSEYFSKTIFPFFYGLLSEGVNKELQCRMLKIDELDYFTRLIKTAGNDTIGAITIKPITAHGADM